MVCVESLVNSPNAISDALLHSTQTRCYLDRPDVFAAINDSDNDFERMLAVVRWTCQFHPEPLSLVGDLPLVSLLMTYNRLPR